MRVSLICGTSHCKISLSFGVTTVLYSCQQQPGYQEDYWWEVIARVYLIDVGRPSIVLLPGHAQDVPHPCCMHALFLAVHRHAGVAPCIHVKPAWSGPTRSEPPKGHADMHTCCMTVLFLDVVEYTDDSSTPTTASTVLSKQGACSLSKDPALSSNQYALNHGIGLVWLGLAAYPLTLLY